MENLLASKQASNRIVWVDIVKGIGIILVVLGHSNPPVWLATFISAFHMPLFFFISGFVYKDPNDGLGKTFRIKKDFVHLVLPYCIVVFLIGIFLLIINSKGDSGYYSSINELLQSALFGSGTGYKDIKLIGEIWFLLAMFWSRRMMDTAFLCHDLKSRFFVVISAVGIGIALAANNVWIALSIDVAFIGLGFLYAGWLVRNKQDIIDNSTVIIFLIMFSFVTISASRFGMADRNYYNLWYVSIPGAIALSILTCKISKTIERFRGVNTFLSFIGKHSLLFICIHSLDWRIPFQKFGQSFVSSFSSLQYYWAIKFLHRFLFDLVFTCLIVIAIYLYRLFTRKIIARVL